MQLKKFHFVIVINFHTLKQNLSFFLIGLYLLEIDKQVT